jgi:M6 family metalloprotease-like protein
MNRPLSSRGVALIAVALWPWSLSAGAGEEVRRFDTGDQRPIRVAVSPDGRFALSGGSDGTVRLWELATGKELKQLKEHTGQAYTVAFRPDGRLALSGGDDNQLILWDLSTGKKIRNFTGHTGCVCGAAFSPDGKRVASGSWDRTIRIWDMATGKELKNLEGHTGDVMAVAFSPDGKMLVSAAADKTVRLWDLDSGKERKVLTGHTATVRAVCFSADGKHALSGAWTEDGSARLWDVSSGKELHRCARVPEGVHGVALSPDGRLALVAGGDGVRLWDLEHGKVLHTFDGLQSASDAAFLPDGQHVLLADGAGKNLRLCRLTNADPSARAFGYENRKVVGKRPLLFLWMRDGTKPKSGHEYAFYEQLFFSSNPRARSIKGYLAEVSHGKFSFELVGKLGPYDYGKFDGVDYRKICSDGIHLARDKGKFNFADYDRNKDGVLTTDELAVLLIYNRWNIDAWTRWSFRNTFERPNLIVDLGGVVGVGEEVGFASINHEIMHSLGIDFEMYESGFHQNLTIMGATLYPGADDRQTFHPDAWLKMQFGWVEPKVYSLAVPGSAVLLAQQLPPTATRHGSVILHDPAKGTREFFLLEYRNPRAAGGSYDASVSSAGVAIWHVIHGNNKWVTRVPVDGAPKATVTSLFNRGAPNWRQGGNQLYTDKHGTIVCKWLDGSDSGVRLHIGPPDKNGASVTIRWDRK